MVDRNPEEARQVMRALFVTPLTVTPIETAEGKRFWIEGAAAVGQMLATDAGCLHSASPGGIGTLLTLVSPAGAVDAGEASAWLDDVA